MPRVSLSQASLCACACTLIAAHSDAAAHDLRGSVSASGLEFVSQQIPGMLPESMSLPEITFELLSCPGDPVTLTQRGTNVEIEATGASLTVPREGVLRLELTLNVWAGGEAFIDNLYACFGSSTCLDQLAIDNAKVSLEFSIDSGNVTVSEATFDVDIEAATMVFSDCAVDDLINAYAKEKLLGFLLTKLQAVSGERLSPLVSDLLAGYTSYRGTLDLADFSVDLADLDATERGLQFVAEADLFSDLPADRCIEDTSIEPGPQNGTPPDLRTTNHLAVAVNLGLIDDALYHVWRDGALCMDLDRIASFGLPLDPQELLTLLPGFAEGTEFELHTTMTAPPRVRANASDAATLSLIIEGLQAEIVGESPSGRVARIALEADATATATVYIDPILNALTLHIDSVDLDRLELDQQGAVDQGFDIGRLHTVAREVVVPALLESMADMPLTGPVFGLAGYHTILRRVATSEGYLTVHIELYRAPDNDRGAPTTAIVSAPSGLVKPADAVVLMTGSDEQIPDELLQFQVTIDGEAGEPSFVRAVRVGEPGRSATYEVAVQAVDLSGNVDPTPAIARVNVDGIHPRIHTDSDPVVRLEGGGAVPLSWVASDDLTPADQIAARVDLFEVLDPTDLLSAERLSSQQIPAGQTSTQLQLENGAIYRVVITVRDQAGNEASAYLLFDAGTGGGCGCSTAASSGSGGLAGLMLAGLMALLALRRASGWRRRRAAVGVAGLALALLAGTGPARAGGLYIPGTGPSAQARAGAFTARADDPTALAHNPAGFAKLDGTQAYFGFNLVDLSLSYARSGTYETSSDGHDYEGAQYPAISDQSSPQFGVAGFQALPVLALATDFGRPEWPVRFGFGLFTPQGYGDRSFPGEHNMGDPADPAPGPQRYDIVNKQIVAVQPSAAVAYRVTPKLDVGVRVSWGIVTLKSRSSVWAIRNYEEVPTKDGHVDIDGKDNFVPTFGLGLLYRPHPAFELGLAYNSATHVNARGDASSALGEAVGLPGLPDTIMPVTGADSHCDPNGTITSLKGCMYLEAAATATVGARWIARDADGKERADLEFDVRWEDWDADCELPDGMTIDGSGTRKCSDFLVVVDARSSLTGLNLQPVLVRHGFKDVFSFRLGGSYRAPFAGDRLTFRAGVAYDTETAPISWNRLDIDGAPRSTAALGAAIDLGKFRLDVGGGVVMQPTRIVAQCKPPGGPALGDAGCPTAGEVPVEQRTAPDPVQPLAGFDQQVESPFNAGTYKSRYVMLSVGVSARF